MRLNLTLTLIAALAVAAGALAQTPAPNEKPAAFACPRTQTLDCMPIVPAERRALCGREYLDWAAKHCAGLRVVY